MKFPLVEQTHAPEPGKHLTLARGADGIRITTPTGDRFTLQAVDERTIEIYTDGRFMIEPQAINQLHIEIAPISKPSEFVGFLGDGAAPQVLWVHNSLLEIWMLVAELMGVYLEEGKPMPAIVTEKVLSIFAQALREEHDAQH